MSTALVLPAQVRTAILAIRDHFRDLNARAQERNAQQDVDRSAAPIVQIGFVTKPDQLGPELQFWAIEDDRALEDFLFDDLLSGLFGKEDVDGSKLPNGYIPLLLVLEFERHCQFEGWTAVSNKGQEGMREIIQAYQYVGLNDEAKALKAVANAYTELANDDHEDFHEILGNAYRSVENSTPEIEDRLPHVFAFVRKNPQLFGVPE